MISARGKVVIDEPVEGLATVTIDARINAEGYRIMATIVFPTMEAYREFMLTYKGELRVSVSRQVLTGKELAEAIMKA